MGKTHEEWLRQADYDMDTADFMHRGGRHFYAVFMAHLSVEKALKGLYTFCLKEVPPKTHNLVWLAKKIEIRPPAGLDMSLAALNEANVATRYPEELSDMMQRYSAETAGPLLHQAKEVLAWIKQKF